MACCTKTGLPVAWSVETAKANESTFVASLIDEARRRGAMAATCAMDKAYDITRVYDECAERDCEAIVPLRATGAVVKNEHRPPACAHGVWTFAGSDRKRGASRWRCPTGECAPASTWVKADRLHPLMPRESKRWKALYRGRGAVEREFGRLKNEWGLKPLRVRGLDRVRLHADLTILTKLACALSRARAVTAQPRRQRGSSHASARPAPIRVRPANSAGVASSDAASLIKVSILATRSPRSSCEISVRCTEALTSGGPERDCPRTALRHSRREPVEVKGGSGRQDRRALSPQQTGSGQVEHGALRPVACADLALYLACSE
jgi:Transposase DDE domain